MNVDGIVRDETNLAGKAEEKEYSYEEEEEERMVEELGMYRGKVRLVNSEEPAEETMLLWGIQQPTFSKPNAFARQTSLQLPIDACGRSLSILQSPSNLGTPGVTGSVMWDSGVVLGKFLEHAVESGRIHLQGKKVVELGSGCGLVGCIAALLGGQVILTDLPDRLRLLKKNVEANLYGDVRGSATVDELTWGDELDHDIKDPLPDYVLGSDVIYSEGAVMDLLATLLNLSGTQTTVILAGELRNDAILEYFLQAAAEDFTIGRVDQNQWHPDCCSPRVVIYVLVKKWRKEK
uniref:Protein N-lysine methyltransferase METTL21A n=1 Tax=Nicotiana sylvestris TaxID=4096 RepID=A0A1U7XLR5_NICSY|nr:PREDICTED: protein N-lysine methyltransferase METTL21A [Nicotiana sylvestris]